MRKRAPRDDRDNGLVHALLYTRVSGAEHQREGLSLEAQTHNTRSYAAMQGWAIAGEYQDILSGARDDRPHYQALLSHARQLHATGSRAAVVVTRLDRLGRHLLEQVRAREELAKLGCDTWAIKEGGKLSDLTAHILMSVAQDERQRIGARVGETRSHVVTSGWHWGRSPFGYRKRPATPEERAAGSRPTVLEPDPSTRGVALEIFERYGRGESIYRISRWLVGLPESLRGGRSWPAQVVWVLLQSPSYVARPAEGAPDVLARPVARWEPLVSDELFDRVRQRLATHKTRPHQATDQYLLTGFARCPQCGHNMVHTSTRRSDQGGKIRGRYRCAGYLKGASAPDPDCRYEMADDRADEVVLGQVAALLDRLNDPRYAPSLRKAWAEIERPTTDVSRQIATLDREIQTSQKRLANAARLLVDGTLDRAGYELLRDAETVAIDAAKAERDRLQATSTAPAQQKLPPIETVLEQAGTWGRILREVDVAHQRAILNELVVRVLVRKTGYRQYTADISWTVLGQALGVKLEGLRAA